MHIKQRWSIAKSNNVYPIFWHPRHCNTIIPTLYMNSARQLPALHLRFSHLARFPFHTHFIPSFAAFFAFLTLFKVVSTLSFPRWRQFLNCMTIKTRYVLYIYWKFCTYLLGASLHDAAASSVHLQPLVDSPLEFLMDLLQFCSVDLQVSSTEHTTIQGAESCTDGVQTRGKRNDTRPHTKTQARIPKRVLYNHRADTTFDPNAITANLSHYRLAF